MDEPTETSIDPYADEIVTFWQAVRHHARTNPLPAYFGQTPGEALTPQAWAFGATEEQGDELLALVLAGTKTATAGALWDYEAGDERLPEVGELSILLDGRGHPHALIGITAVDVVPFDEVSEEHAYLEGEDDRTLASWRTGHERFFTEHALHDRGFDPSMPIVLERFELLYPS